MRKEQISKQIAQIDEVVKEATGVDLGKLDRQLDATRKVFTALDLNTLVVGGDIFIIKSKLKNLVH